MKKTIILIHGMWGGGWYWQPMKRYLEAQGYECLTPDLRHHGESQMNPVHDELGELSLLDYVADLEALIQTLPHKPIVIGHSMGGIIAQKLAERDLIERLVLVCPAPPNDVFAISASALKCFFPLIMQRHFWKKPHRPSFKSAVYSSFQLIPEDQRQDYYRQLGYDSGKVIVEIALPFLDKHKATAVKASRVKCPTLVLAAEFDKLIPVAVAKKVANKYPQADFHCFKGQTHWVMAEPGWETCAEYISKWLSAE